MRKKEMTKENTVPLRISKAPGAKSQTTFGTTLRN